ncbi:MAG: hypothetical protein ABJE95_19560 [Byssovorax sp.]
MTIDADGLIKLLDRFGLPTVYLLVLGWLAYRVINGPATALAAKMGDGFGVLAKSGSEFLARLTASMEATHVAHVEAKSHATAGVAELKEVIKAEGTSTREHVTDAIDKVRDRVSTAQTTIESTVRASAAEHVPPPSTSVPRATAPTLPESCSATRSA